MIAGIDPARLPATESAVGDVLAAPPLSVGGHVLTSRTAREVKYADGTTFTTAPLTEAAGPGMAMTTFFSRFLNSGQFTVTAQNAPDASLLWFVGTGREPYLAHVAAAASSSGTWLFGVDATSSAAADDLLAGFAAVVG